MMSRPEFSRRSFVEGIGAAAVGGALASCGGSSAIAPSGPSTTTYDVLIVGSGMAAVGAARAVMSYGRSVLMIEAQNHTGGRIILDSTTFPEQPFDLGAQYFHQALSNNPLYGIAQALGYVTTPVSSLGAPVMVEGTNQANAIDMGAFFSTYASVQTAVNGAGLLASQGAADVSCGAATAGAGVTSDPFYSLASDVSIGARTGAAPDLSSAEDFFNFSIISPAPLAFPPGDDVLMQAGMGALIARLMSGVPRVLSSPVTKIDYSGGNVVVTTVNATYTGRTVIVTPSVGVLNSNTITFAPALPSAFSTAIGTLKMGTLFKGVLGFKSDVFSGKAGVPPGAMTYVVPLLPGGQPACIVNFWQHKMVMFYADADLATAFENMGTNAAAALLAVLETHFPGATAAWDGRFAGTTWSGNAFTRGAYAYVTPGNSNARVLLQAGVSSKVWFAGEALSVSSHGSQHAAYISGTNAAYAALGSLGVVAAGQLAPAATRPL